MMFWEQIPDASFEKKDQMTNPEQTPDTSFEKKDQMTNPEHIPKLSFEKKDQMTNPEHIPKLSFEKKGQMTDPEAAYNVKNKANKIVLVILYMLYFVCDTLCVLSASTKSEVLQWTTVPTHFRAQKVHFSRFRANKTFEKHKAVICECGCWLTI